jgi:hypothetical protein
LRFTETLSCFIVCTCAKGWNTKNWKSVPTVSLFFVKIISVCHFLLLLYCSCGQSDEHVRLTLSLLMSYIYMELLVKPEILTSCIYTGCLQKNGAVSKINKKFISHLTRAKRTPSAAATVQVFYALIIILQCMHPGPHDTHPHDNRIRPI